jgi:phosphoribosylamine--glycine ligase
MGAKVKVLVLGKGGREHALVWKLAQSPRVTAVYCAPGNAGTAVEARNVAIDPSDLNDIRFKQLTDFVKKENIDLTVVGPEEPLVRGIVDAFEHKGLLIFGPSKEAAQLEGSKIFAKELMRHAGVPTAAYRTFHSVESAERYLTEREESAVVVKADGLAAGKGAMVCRNRAEAIDAVNRIMRKREFGAAGSQIVIEEKLEGEEVSILTITDGRTIVTLDAAQDHKAAFDHDEGPNTGGMGAYSPAPAVTSDLISEIEQKILVPTVHAMKRRRTPFRGVLYAGLMLTKQGPKVLEFNVRFGDPECQPLMMRLRTDLVDVIEATLNGKLSALSPLQWDPRPAVCVVLAAEGYPGSYMKGRTISGLEDAVRITDSKVFHAGTNLRDGKVVTEGGRVFGVTALGDDFLQAKERAYESAGKIQFAGVWSRRDIADKVIRSIGTLDQGHGDVGDR